MQTKQQDQHLLPKQRNEVETIWEQKQNQNQQTNKKHKP